MCKATSAFELMITSLVKVAGNNETLNYPYARRDQAQIIKYGYEYQ